MENNEAAKPRLVKFSAEQDAALNDLADRTNRTVANLIREAIADYTHVPDKLGTRRRRREP
jgi:predicted DNA-binding protein